MNDTGELTPGLEGRATEIRATPGRATQKTVARAAVINQMLWSAGSTLTGGAFLTYFANDLGAKGFLLAVILALPETVGIVALVTRSAVRACGARRRVWIVCSLAARVASIGIPLMGFAQLQPPGDAGLYVLIGCLAAAQAMQAVAYIAYLSWLSDLVPETNWGAFFAKRSLARIAVQLSVPLLAAELRQWWKPHLSGDQALLAYVGVFAVGIVLQTLSMVPVWRLPEAEQRDPLVRAEAAAVESSWRRLGSMSGSFWLLLVHNWHLALANGLTQAAFFKYRIGPLGISLTQYYLLDGAMLVAMIPVSLAAGRWGDRRGYKAMLFWSSLVASLAMPFWFLATRDAWGWLFGAHLVWSAFAAVNLAGYNLALTLAPRSDNSFELALFQQGAGLLAGLSGLFGGWWLDQLLTGRWTGTFAGLPLDSYRLVILVSFAGRLTAPFWVLGIRESRRS